MKSIIIIFFLSISIFASSLGSKIDNSAKSEKNLEEVSKKINSLIVNVAVMSVYNLAIKSKITFNAQKQKQLIELIEE